MILYGKKTHRNRYLGSFFCTVMAILSQTAIMLGYGGELLQWLIQCFLQCVKILIPFIAIDLITVLINSNVSFTAPALAEQFNFKNSIPNKHFSGAVTLSFKLDLTGVFTIEIRQHCICYKTVYLK